MSVKIVASQRIGPLRIRRARGGTTRITLRIGPLAWTRTTADRRQAQTRAAQRAAGRRLLLAELAVAGLLVAAIAGAAWPWLALAGAVALVAGAGWARRCHALPDLEED